MKKWILSIVAAVILLCMSVQVFAREDAVSMTDAFSEPGKTVLLTVRLNESVVGDTLAISYSFDSEHLTAVTGSSRWLKSGVLSDFNNKNGGVWAATAAADLKGDVCTLAFRINTGISFESTKVSCKLVVKNGAQTVGEYMSEAIVNINCNHGTYGDWTYKDVLVHTSICAQCGKVQSGTHKWDAGVESPNPADPLSSLLTLTCETCKGTKTIVVPDSLSEPDGTKPDHSHPDNPNNGNTGETEPQEPECTDPNHNHSHSDEFHKPTGPSDQDNSNDHDHGTSVIKPDNSTSDDHTGHDHSHENKETNTTNWVVGAVVFLVAAALVAGGVILVMKKK